MKNIQLSPISLLAGSAATAGIFLLTGMQGSTDPFVHGDVREFLSHVSMVDLPDGQGGFNRTVRISGINVQVVNGMGSTDTINGTGNLVVGYDEVGDSIDHTGSHNLVSGRFNSYSSYGGFVASRGNAILAPHATVTGGSSNIASGGSSSICGGFDNQASGAASSISGGRANSTTGQRSWVAGGYGNTASGPLSTVSGGTSNAATGYGSSVSGGNNRTATGTDDWVAGSLFEDD